MAMLLIVLVLLVLMSCRVGADAGDVVYDSVSTGASAIDGDVHFSDGALVLVCCC